jgi:multiple sugar transport system substrate-binding protein
MSDQEINSPLPARPSDLPQTESPVVPVQENSSFSAPRPLPTKSFPILPVIIISILLILLFVFITVLLPKLKTNAVKVTTLNYWGLWEDRSIMEGVISDFEAKNPTIKINYKIQQKTDYRSRLVGRLAKDSSVEEVPDIFRIHSSWLPAFSGKIAPVPATVANSIGLDTDFYNVYKNDLKKGNNYLAIPLMYDGLSLFYNLDLIEKAQVTIPKTWWDFQSLTSKITVRDSEGRITVAGVAMGLTDNVDHWQDIVGLILKQNGADITKNDSENNGKIQDVITYFTNFKKDYKTWDETMPNSTEAFINGKLAFYFGPSWRVFNIKDGNPSLKFAITTVPQLATIADKSTNSSADLTNIHWATYWVEAVNNKSSHQKEAWKFLEYLASKEGLQKMYTAAAQTRDFGEIYPRISLANEISSNQMIKPFISVANDAESGYLSSNTYDGGLNSELSKYFSDAINNVALNQAEISSVMTPLRSGIDQVIQKNLLP